jgi:hypothetical protein
LVSAIVATLFLLLPAHHLSCLLYYLSEPHEMELDFVHPENNQGMLVLKGSEILVGQEVVDAITIIRPLEDVEDFRQGRIKARLLADRTGIRISLPAAPAFLIEAKDINALYELDGRNACAATKRAHDIVATDIQVDDEHQIRHIIAYFLEGITCSNSMMACMEMI